MSRFELWFLRRILRRHVVGYKPILRCTELYSLIRAAAVEEFPEDNALTMDDFLAECFAASQFEPRKWYDHT